MALERLMLVLNINMDSIEIFLRLEIHFLLVL